MWGKIKRSFKNNDSVVASMFWSAFLTTSIIEFSAVGSGLIDGIIISKMLGPASMAAEGIAHPFFSISGLASGLLAVGMQSLNGDALSRGDVKETQRIFSQTATVSLIISGILSVILFFFSNEVAQLLGARGNGADLLTEASGYLKGLSLGCVPMILCVVLASAIQMDSGSRLVQIAAIVGSVTDIVFDYIAAKAGWGMYGMGLATSLCYVVNLVLLLLHFLKKDRMLRFTASGWRWKVLSDIASLGSEKAIRRLVNVLRPIALNAIIIAVGGSMGMSALSIRNNVGNFLEIPMSGIAGATALLTSVFYGEKSKEECIETAKLAHKYTLVYCVTVGLGTLLLSNRIAAYYVSEAGELRDLVRFAMHMLAIGLLFSTLLLCRTSYLQATRQMKSCQVLTSLSKLIVIVPCAFICVNFWQSRGVIAAFAISDLLICLGIHIFYATRRSSKKLFPSVEEYMALSEDFNVLPQNIIELSVKDEEEAVLTSEQVQMFCKGHHFEPAKVYNAALCTEELLMNILTHGSKGGRRIKQIDVRVLIVNNDIVLRIRDHCPKFDLTERIKTIQSEDDPTRNIGIRLVSKTAKDIKYVNILDTNTLIITL